MKANSVLETIGHTPHIRLSRLFPDAEVWVKSERSNPGGSIKDRIGIAMIEAAETIRRPPARRNHHRAHLRQHRRRPRHGRRRQGL